MRATETNDVLSLSKYLSTARQVIIRQQEKEIDEIIQRWIQKHCMENFIQKRFAIRLPSQVGTHLLSEVVTNYSRKGLRIEEGCKCRLFYFLRPARITFDCRWDLREKDLTVE